MPVKVKDEMNSLFASTVHVAWGCEEQISSTPPALDKDAEYLVSYELFSKSPASISISTASLGLISVKSSLPDILLETKNIP